MVPTSLPLKNAVKDVACAQKSELFRNTIKRTHLQKRCVHLYKFSVPSVVVVLAVLLSLCQRGKNTVMRARKKELGD